MQFTSLRRSGALAGGAVAASLLACMLLVAPAGAAGGWPEPSNLTANPDPVVPGNTLALSWECGASGLAGASATVHGAGTGEVLAAVPSWDTAPTITSTVDIPADWTPGVGEVEFMCLHTSGDFTFSSMWAKLPLAIGEQPAFTDVSLPEMVAASAFSDGVAASGAPAASYAVSGGALPPGITLDAASGALTGTPTTPGTYSFTITATNDLGSASHDFVVVVAVPATPPANDGTLEVSVVDLAPEGSTTLVATGYKPGTEVAFYIYSEPQLLGTATADENGIATLVATLPAALPIGQHTVVSLGEDALGGDRVMSQQVNVSLPQAPGVPTPEPTTTTTPGPELPRTGGDTLPLALVGALLLGGGAVLVARSRRLVRS